MSEERIQSFQEFWPYYLREHRQPLCRALHYLGTTLSVGTLAAAILSGNPWLFALIAVVGYGPAWVGHFFIEHNRPATFKYPKWSLMADFKMYACFLSGSLDAELQRAGATAS